MLLIFDWDGTLADSTSKIVRCLSAASEEVGLPLLSARQYQHIIGLALPEAALALYPDYPLALRTTFTQAYSRLFVADQQPIEFFEGVLEQLPLLKADGFKLAIATSKTRRGLNRQLDHFAIHDWFDATRCADETASKPEPLMLNELLVELGVGADQALMVGDTQFDMEMANLAGLRGLAVSYGAHSVEQLTAAKPVAIADDFAEVCDLCQRLLQQRVEVELA